MASDNAVINATQNIGVDISELENVINHIKNNISYLNKNDAETIADSIEMI